MPKSRNRSSAAIFSGRTDAIGVGELAARAGVPPRRVRDVVESGAVEATEIDRGGIVFSIRQQLAVFAALDTKQPAPRLAGL